MESYFSNRFQRIVLNGQTSSWRPILASVPQWSILGDLPFIININDKPDGLKSNVKLFADDASILSIVKNKNDIAKDLTHDLLLIWKWAFYWKMLFNLDPTKPAQEVIFSRKKRWLSSSNIFFDDMSVENASHHKHLRIYHDKKLNFKMDIETVLCKVNKSISIIKKGISFQVRTITNYLQRVFKTPYWLWQCNLRPTHRWTFLWKTRISPI